MTVHDYRMMPETGPRYQLVQGRFYMSPAPNRFHQQIVGNIYHLFRTFLDARPVGEAYPTPFDVYLTEIDVYQPDVLFVSNEKRIHPDRPGRGRCPGSPGRSPLAEHRLPRHRE
jgi:hypothetical protein